MMPLEPPLAPGEAPCKACQGTGAGKFLNPAEPCEVCGGSGHVPAPESGPSMTQVLQEHTKALDRLTAVLEGISMAWLIERAEKAE